MTAKLWNRRQLMATSALTATGVAFASIGPSALAFQMPRPEPLNDSSITCLTTTETAAWQSTLIFTPTFQWEMLSLKIASDQSKAEHAIEGFVGCFNELGWTSLQLLSPQDRTSVIR